MARVSTYLNFPRTTEAAFDFYRSVFRTDYLGPIARFAALAAGGAVEMPLQEMFWGGYFGSLTDRFGIRWMVNCASKA